MLHTFWRMEATLSFQSRYQELLFVILILYHLSYIDNHGLHWSKQEQNILLRRTVLTPPCPRRPCLLLKWRSSRQISSSLLSRLPWSPTSVTMPVLWVVTGCPRSRRLPLRSESVPVPTKECYMLYWGDKKLWSIRVLYSIYYVYGTCCSVAGLTAVFLLMKNVWAISFDLLLLFLEVTDWVIFRSGHNGFDILILLSRSRGSCQI